MLFGACGWASFACDEVFDVFVDALAKPGVCLAVCAHFLAEKQGVFVDDAAFGITNLLRVGAFAFAEQVTHLSVGDFACELEMCTSATGPLSWWSA